MPTRVLLTVDTELTSRHLGAGESWRENLARSFDPAGVGVTYQLRMLARHGLKACFFVDPMPALVYGLEPVRRMVEPILDAGQEVQLHLHSFWKDVADGRAEKRYALTDFDPAGQRDLIRTAYDLLAEAGAPKPVAFRAGSYAADAATLDALHGLGIAYDSSHNGMYHPGASALPLDPRLIDPVRCRGVVEIPITQLAQPGGRLRHLQICAVSSAEMIGALATAERFGHPLVTIVSHSFELATRDGLRPNRHLQARFERLCAFLDDQSDRFPTARFADLGPFPLAAGKPPLPSRRGRRTARVAQQLWSAARYEQPGRALTAVYGSSVSGAEWLLPLLAG